MSIKQQTNYVNAAKLQEQFTSACREHFAFMEKEHGLPLVESGQHGREFVVSYANGKYALHIYFEYPGPPWIAIEKKTGRSSKRKGLHQLYKRVFNSEMPSTVRGANDKSVEGDELSNLPILSEIVRENRHDLISAF